MYQITKALANLRKIKKKSETLSIDDRKVIGSTIDLLEKAEIISTVGNGAVTAVLNGQGKFKSVKLTASAINPSNPESVDSDTIEMLEDLLSQAFQDATKKANDQMEAKMKAVTGGVSIPGLF